MKNFWLFLPFLYICLLCDEVLLPWNFGTPRFDIRAFEIYKNDTFSYFLDLNLRNSCQIASLFVAMGPRIPGKQDRSSMIIEGPPGPPKW